MKQTIDAAFILQRALGRQDRKHLQSSETPTFSAFLNFKISIVLYGLDYKYRAEENNSVHI